MRVSRETWAFRVKVAWLVLTGRTRSVWRTRTPSSGWHVSVNIYERASKGSSS